MTKVVKPKKVVAKALALKANKTGASPREEKTFDMRHPGGDKHNAEELSELWEFAIASCYGLGAILFGGVDEDVLVRLPDRARARVIINDM